MEITTICLSIIFIILTGIFHYSKKTYTKYIAFTLSIIIFATAYIITHNNF